MKALFLPSTNAPNARLLFATGGLAAGTRGILRARADAEPVPAGALALEGETLRTIAQRARIRCDGLPPDAVPNWRMIAALKLTPLPANESVSLFQSVQSAVAQMSEPEKTILTEALKGADFQRASPAVASIAAALGLSREQVDIVFRLAAGFPEP